MNTKEQKLKENNVLYIKIIQHVLNNFQGMVSDLHKRYLIHRFFNFCFLECLKKLHLITHMLFPKFQLPS